MNDKIGDYIHYHFQNYKRCGLNFKQTQKTNPDDMIRKSFAKAKNDYIKEIHKIDNKFIKKYEDLLNAVLYPKDNSNTFMNDTYNKLFQIIGKVCDEEFKKMLPTVSLTTKEGNLTMSDHTQIKSIKNKYDTYMYYIKYWLKLGSIDNNIADKMIQELNLVKNSDQTGTLKNIGADIPTLKQYFFADAIKDAFRNTSRIGENFEVIATTVGVILSQMKDGSIKDIVSTLFSSLENDENLKKFKETIEAAHSASNTYNPVDRIRVEHFIPGVDLSFLNKNNNLSSNPKVKADATLTFSANSGIGVSMKSFEIKGWEPRDVLSLQKNSPLLNSIVQVSGSREFINHYLNIRAANDQGNQTKINDNRSSYYYFADLHLQKLLILVSYAGNLLDKQNNSSIFIMNNRSAKKVTCKSILQLADDVMRLNDLSQYYKINIIPNLEFRNNYRKTKEDRLSEIIKQLYEKKISIALKLTQI